MNSLDPQGEESPWGGESPPGGGLLGVGGLLQVGIVPMGGKTYLFQEEFHPPHDHAAVRLKKT